MHGILGLIRVSSPNQPPAAPTHPRPLDPDRSQMTHARDAWAAAAADAAAAGAIAAKAERFHGRGGGGGLRKQLSIRC